MTALAGAAPARSEWLTVKEAAARAKLHPNSIYLAIRQGRLRAARLGTRKDYRLLEDWLDAWIISCSTPVEVVVPEAEAVRFNRRGRKALP